MAGMGDSNGLNLDALSQFLAKMQDTNWGGILAPGFPGTGKSQLGKAAGFEAGGLFIKFDMGAMKGGIVGDSERNVRQALEILEAMSKSDDGDSRVLFIGTCNSMEGLKPELKRRFSYGTFFFDLPTPEEREPIWQIYLKQYKLEGKRPDDEGWTGAEIETCCKRADEFGISLLESAKFVTPVIKLMGDDVDKLRKSADGKYLSATNEGFYKTPRNKGQRSFDRIIDSEVSKP